MTFVQDVDQLVVIKACLFSTISVCQSTVDTCKGHCQGKDGWTDTSHCLMGIDKKEIKKVKTTSGNRQRYRKLKMTWGTRPRKATRAADDIQVRLMADELDLRRHSLKVQFVQLLN